MLRHPDYTRERIQQFADRVRALIYPQTVPAGRILVSPRVDRISHAEAMRLKYRPTKLGEQFGPLWATFWFRVEAEAPREWAGRRVDLLWVSHGEATLWLDGQSRQGLNFEPTSWDKAVRPDALLTARAKPGERLRFHVEMACNGLFGKPDQSPYRNVSPFVLDQCEIAVFDPQAWEIYHDLRVLRELEADAKNGLEPSWAGELLYELNRFVNTFDPADRSTWAKAHRILRELYTRHTAANVHELSVIGHAHIDTAWLWPLAETHRKCERTFSSQTSYMERYPQFKFSCSQAYQYEVIRRRNPDLWARIRKYVKNGQWVPVGGTWIEPDCNIPSGESLARQFLHGQRYFQEHFGRRCREFWNPDVFGYNGQLPQIMRLAGIGRFLTQKLSWNRFNKPHHHTFTWQGIDGSEVLAHFPPAETYNATASVEELRRNARDYKDHDRSRHSLMLFGYGDGGGGPTPQMLETLSRCADLQGLPRVSFHSSDEFFDLLEADCTDRPLIIGELYFEYHRGTYTTQAATKRANRKSEILLHDVEFLSAVAARLRRGKYPRETLDELWKVLLLQQFHDILPGSSITLVYEDAARDFARIAREGGRLRDAALASLVKGGGKGHSPLNACGFDREEVAALPEGRLVFVEAPSYGVGRVREASDSVRIEKDPKGNFVMENAALQAVLAPDGRLLSLFCNVAGRDALASPGNVLEVYDDRPTNFDAWDVDPFHLETRRECDPADSARIVGTSPLRAEVRFERKIGRASAMTQTVRLDAGARRLEFHCEVDWREEHTMLKVAFPVDVRAMNATYEMQFGAVERPTHYNTTYDLARYEVPGHRWADLSEPGFGVALLSESKYGFSTFGHTMRMSLLRSPKSPDPVADMGRQVFAYAVMPHAGGWREAGVVAEAARFNMPILWAKGTAEPCSYFSVEDPNLVLDTVKQAEDSTATILRFYEAHGARGRARIRLGLPCRKAVLCNLLEDQTGVARLRDDTLELAYRPWEILTVKLT